MDQDGRRCGYSTGQATRLRLLEAAEALFGDRGIDSVSLNEVRIAAGQSNAAAVNYHFGSKEGLLRAIIEHRIARIEDERAAMLDALQENESADARSVLAAIVRPQVRSIERGERYVALAAQLLAGDHDLYGDYAFLLSDPALSPNGQRIHALLKARVGHLPPPVADRRLALLHTSSLRALAQHQRRRDAAGAPPTPLFVAELIDALAGMLTAPVSPETLALLETRAHAEQ
ncbi:hypothetical protein BJF79_06825 [Actinomadura sp. CNU-125]|uniref:TetR/AcrR family transcriptional regulator n=1 Tax=Actinomadura sp. CNU-125 TaxID=1904961 RepID=UPI00095E70C5|nr:TetR/AcrR family transcriptional regulator [Actinomadura sp. CNU-125]OLT36315.1 hypothetical protein BJF79_06825 [Actinomadura sp. CNU-125]